MNLEFNLVNLKVNLNFEGEFESELEYLLVNRLLKVIVIFGNLWVLNWKCFETTRQSRPRESMT